MGAPAIIVSVPGSGRGTPADSSPICLRYGGFFPLPARGQPCWSCGQRPSIHDRFPCTGPQLPVHWGCPQVPCQSVFISGCDVTRHILRCLYALLYRGTLRGGWNKSADYRPQIGRSPSRVDWHRDKTSSHWPCAPCRRHTVPAGAVVLRRHVFAGSWRLPSSPQIL